MRIAEYRSQRLCRRVRGSPGTFPITDVPVTLIEAINLAGGLIDNADVFDAIDAGRRKHRDTSYDMLYEKHECQRAGQHGDVTHVAPNEPAGCFGRGHSTRPYP